METETIDKLYLELSQVTNAISEREIMLLEALDHCGKEGNSFERYAMKPKIQGTFKEWFRHKWENENHEKRNDAPEANENTRSEDRRDSYPEVRKSYKRDGYETPSKR